LFAVGSLSRNMDDQVFDRPFVVLVRTGNANG
jgi:hypothetical protein